MGATSQGVTTLVEAVVPGAGDAVLNEMGAIMVATKEGGMSEEAVAEMRRVPITMPTHFKLTARI